jgi:hypothetical protein
MVRPSYHGSTVYPTTSEPGRHATLADIRLSHFCSRLPMSFILRDKHQDPGPFVQSGFDWLDLVG